MKHWLGPLCVSAALSLMGCAQVIGVDANDIDCTIEKPPPNTVCACGDLFLNGDGCDEDADCCSGTCSPLQKEGDKAVYYCADPNSP